MSEKNTIKEMSYWNDFYSSNEFEMPSQFCTLLASESSRTIPVIEFGCGNGRDSLFLARHGYHVYAIDLSMEAIKKCNSKSESMDNIEFRQGDVTVESDVSALIIDAKNKHKNSSVIAYSRFFFHSIDSDQEDLLLSYLSKYLETGDSLYLEFRSKEDEGTNKIFNSHYRRYVDSEKLIEKLINEHNFEISYSIVGKGMAKYKAEDAIVARIIALKK